MVKPRVSILVPASDVTPTVFWTCLLKLIEWVKSGDDFELIYQVSTTKPLDKARDKMVTFSLANGADYILFLDSDMVFDKRLLHKLFAHKKDIVSALYFAKTYPYRPVARNWNKEEGYSFVIDYPEKSLIKVGGVGMGACLIKADVFRRMQEPYFTFDKGFGEDIYFCHQARNLGYDVWLDTSQMLRHYGGIGMGHESFEYVKHKLESNPPQGVSFEEIKQKLRRVQDIDFQTNMPLSEQATETIPEKIIFDTKELRKKLEGRIVDELMQFTGLPEQEVLLNMSQGNKMTREEFLATNPKTDEELEAFYRNSKNYLWDLSGWHSLLDKQRSNRGTMGLMKASYPKAKKVLDFGCGIGEIGFAFAKGGFQVTMVDFPTSAFEFAKFRQKNYPPTELITFEEMRKNLNNYKGQFDLVLAFDVLEHLSVTQLDEVVTELLSLRSPTGDVISMSAFGWGTKKGGSHPMHFDMDDERKKIMGRLWADRRNEVEISFDGQKKEVG
jgi:SAM-dependent methyltransferase